MVALGAMAKLTGSLSLTDIEGILTNFFPPDKQQFISLNAQAIRLGYKSV
jgi:Pyruvate/2-oxoacid:ferredoxin oxidoreductase gamma subunit